MSDLPPDLQGAFVESLGAPIPFGDEQIVQGDRWSLEGPVVVEVRLLGAETQVGQEVRLSIKKPGKIELSDRSYVNAVAIADEASLPRFARHRVEPKGRSLLVYNAYSVQRDGRSYGESWTGNAGMIVTTISDTVRRYECSDGNGAFNRADLVFEIQILPSDAPWLPEEIYN